MDDHVPCQRCGATFGPPPVFDSFWNEWTITCGHCGMKTTQRAPQPVDPANLPVYYVLLECPQCRSTDCPVTSSQGKVRQHKCRGCGHCFKSDEKRLSEILKL